MNIRIGDEVNSAYLLYENTNPKKGAEKFSIGIKKL